MAIDWQVLADDLDCAKGDPFPIEDSKSQVLDNSKITFISYCPRENLPCPHATHSLTTGMPVSEILEGFAITDFWALPSKWLIWQV